MVADCCKCLCSALCAVTALGVEIGWPLVPDLHTFCVPQSYAWLLQHAEGPGQAAAQLILEGRPGG